MIDKEEVLLLIEQAELHLRNLRTELNEVGRALDKVKETL